MRLIFIRHAEPDYKKKCLTEKGAREAEILSRRVAGWKNIKKIYVSPLPRAQMTAAPCLAKLGMEAETLPYLQEFSYFVRHPNTGEPHVPWDFYPETFTADVRYYDPVHWIDTPLYQENPQIAVAYRELSEGLDGILTDCGYARIAEEDCAGTMYRLDRSRTDGDEEDLVLFFCHFGMMSFALAHLTRMSPAALLHHTVVLPTGITVLNAEKRNPEYAHFRTQVIGDVRHLYEAGEPFSAYAAFSPVFQG